MVDLPNTPEIVVLSRDDEPMECLKDRLEDENDPKEDKEIDEVGKEQQIDHRIDEAKGEQ